MSVAARLRPEGFTVDVAHDGPSAVARANDFHDVLGLAGLLVFPLGDTSNRLHSGSRGRSGRRLDSTLDKAGNTRCH